MEQQLVMFVEDVATGELRKAELMPITDGMLAVLDACGNEDGEIEGSYRFDQMIVIAQNYGKELARRALSPETLHARIWGFADGMSASGETPLSGDERELLRNACFAAARPWLS
jgi:hypothetical protein